MADMSRRTISEALVKQVFAEHNVQCNPVPTRPNERTPDFIIEVAQPVVCEVKQIRAERGGPRAARESVHARRTMDIMQACSWRDLLRLVDQLSTGLKAGMSTRFCRVLRRSPIPSNALFLACVAQFIFEELGLRRAYRTPDVEMIPDLYSGLLNRCLSRPTLVTNDRPRAKHRPHGSVANRSTLPSSASPPPPRSRSRIRLRQ